MKYTAYAVGKYLVYLTYAAAGVHYWKVINTITQKNK